MKRARTVLLLTNSTDSTSDYLAEGLLSAGISVTRYNTDVDLENTQFSYHCASMVMRWGNVELRPNNISHVIFRRPKPFQPCIQGDKFQVQHAGDEWAETWESFLSAVPHELWINHPSRNFAASHKIEQLGRASHFGLRIPQTLVSTSPDLALEFYRQHPRGVVVKPLASGYIERDTPDRDSLIYTRKLEPHDLKVIDRIKACPVMFQEMINKDIDIRLTVLDGQMVAAGLKAFDSERKQRLDIRRFNMEDVEYEDIRIPDEIKSKVRILMDSYGIRFAAIDFARDFDGTWVYFEINPNGQWAWMDINAEFKIIDLFRSALV